MRGSATWGHEIHEIHKIHETHCKCTWEGRLVCTWCAVAAVGQVSVVLQHAAGKSVGELDVRSVGWCTRAASRQGVCQAPIGPAQFPLAFASCTHDRQNAGHGYACSCETSNRVPRSTRPTVHSAAYATHSPSSPKRCFFESMKCK